MLDARFTTKRHQINTISAQLVGGDLTRRTNGFKIVIDARESGTSTGRYIDKLIEHLGKLTSEHSFTILTKEHRMSYIRKSSARLQSCGMSHLKSSQWLSS